MPKRSASSMTMTVASGTSTPTSITVVATSTSSVAGPERLHGPLLVGRRQLAVEQADPQPGELVRGQALGLGDRRGGLDPLRSLDQRAHHEGPVAGGHLGAHPRPRLLGLERRPEPGGGDRACRPGGSSSMTVMSRSPKTTMAAVRGIGVAVMTSRSGSRPAVRAPSLVPEGGPLLDPEAVLLVDDHDPEGSEAAPGR